MRARACIPFMSIVGAPRSAHDADEEVSRIAGAAVSLVLPAHSVA